VADSDDEAVGSVRMVPEYDTTSASVDTLTGAVTKGTQATSRTGSGTSHGPVSRSASVALTPPLTNERRVRLSQRLV